MHNVWRKGRCECFFVIPLHGLHTVRHTEDTFHSEYEYQISYIIRMLMTC